MVTYRSHEIQSHVLTAEGAQIVLQGSHEARVFNALPMKGSGASMNIKDLKAAVGDDTTKIGQAIAFKNKWISKEGDGFVRAVS